MDNTIRKVGIAIFKDKKILMARSAKNPEVFYVPGGKFEKDESDIECLKRECLEELSTTIKDDTIKFLHEFKDQAYGKEKGVLFVMRLYSVEVEGEPAPQSEIAELQYFDSSVDKKHLSETGLMKIFPWLKENGYIN